MQNFRIFIIFIIVLLIIFVSGVIPKNIFARETRTGAANNICATIVSKCYLQFFQAFLCKAKRCAEIKDKEAANECKKQCLNEYVSEECQPKL